MNNKFISFRVPPEHLEKLEKISGDVSTSLTAKQILIDYLDKYGENPKLDPLEMILDRLEDISKRLENLENKLDSPIETFVIKSLNQGLKQRAIGRELAAKGWASSADAGFHQVQEIIKRLDKKVEEQ